MVQKAHLQSKYVVDSLKKPSQLPLRGLGGFFVFLFLLACSQAPKKQESKLVYLPVDASVIPKDTLNASNPQIVVKNGVYFFQNKPFSGFIMSFYENQKKQQVMSFWQGKLHGVSKSFYPNGKLKEERNYKDNLAYGRHFGFWENGKPKFDFFYIDEKSHGLQRQWYESGQIYLELHLENDSEKGMQRAWRENGKLFANYEARDGARYGLQKTALCYTLRDEKFKIK